MTSEDQLEQQFFAHVRSSLEAIDRLLIVVEHVRGSLPEMEISGKKRRRAESRLGQFRTPQHARRQREVYEKRIAQYSKLWQDTFGALDNELSATLNALRNVLLNDEVDRITAEIDRLNVDSINGIMQRVKRRVGEFLPRAGLPSRRGHRREVREWMKDAGIKTIEVAAKRLAVSRSTLVSIMSDKGQKRYSESKLKEVLRKIGIKET
jgi:hypothetical protein